MEFVDLHCDTIKAVADGDGDFPSGQGLHIGLPQLADANVALQVFACFVMATGNPEQDYKSCKEYLAAIDDLVASHSEQLSLVRSKADLHTLVAARSKGRRLTGIVKAVEGAVPLQGRVDLLDEFYRDGVRLLTIAWDDNEFCGTVFGSGGGLTTSGEQLIQRCNELGVIVDVSHASDEAFWNIAEITDKPFIASHSNARSVCANERNLNDEMIREIADRGGMIGLALGSGFICPEYYVHDKQNRIRIIEGFKNGTMTNEKAERLSEEALGSLPPARIEQLVEHIRHVINVGGENCLGFGSDFDGVTGLIADASGIGVLPEIAGEMVTSGLSQKVVEKICSGNALRFFGEQLA